MALDRSSTYCKELPRENRRAIVRGIYMVSLEHEHKKGVEERAVETIWSKNNNSINLNNAPILYLAL